MNSWGLFLLIVLVLGIVLSNIMLLKHSANMKLPKSVRKAIKDEIEKKNREKPTDK